MGLESKLENVKLKQENQKLRSLMHTEYFRTDELDQYSRKENVRIFGIPEDYTVEDDGKKLFLKLAGKLDITRNRYTTSPQVG